MKKGRIFFFVVLWAAFLSSCANEDSFHSSSDARLSFSVDTLSMDTVFAKVPAATKTFWVYNWSRSGLRCANVRLERGNQTGFRVNVDGIYLGETTGYQTGEVEIRRKDSIRVFVEMTANATGQAVPKKVEDHLVFTLENGVQQRVSLKAYSWDALLLRNVHIKRDSVMASKKPIIVYGGIKVDSAATLTVTAGTTLYFHANARMDVFGRLLAEGTAAHNVVLRGDRIDRMFDYLPYDRVSGQWGGVRFHSSSYGNVLTYTDIHSAMDGVWVDSADVNRLKLTMNAVTIHNHKGYGLAVNTAYVKLINCQITNALNDCFLLKGGKTEINGCTFAQFYPFDAERGVAFRLINGGHSTLNLQCRNTLITGFADNVCVRAFGDRPAEGSYLFNHCVIRMPKVTTEDSVHFTQVIYEDVVDTARTGDKNFVKIDTRTMKFDFNLRRSSIAVGKADSRTAPVDDRRGEKRDEKPDIGAFEYRQNRR